MLSSFTRGTILLPNDDVLPTVDASTECFEENLLPNGALLPNSAHMSVSSLYQFFVLTGPCYDLWQLSVLTPPKIISYYYLNQSIWHLSNNTGVACHCCWVKSSEITYITTEDQTSMH
jgi:hypothetical protein